MTKDINLEDELNPSPDDVPGAPTTTPKEGMPNDESVDPNMPVADPDLAPDYIPDDDPILDTDETDTDE